MPITTKHTTVYVASDGSEHPTLEAAQNAEREIQLEALFDEGAAYGEIATRTAAERVVECWTAIKAIMEGELPAVQAAVEDILADEAARVERDWGGANVAPRPERSIPRLPMRACAECGRISRSGAHDPSCSRYVKSV